MNARNILNFCQTAPNLTPIYNPGFISGIFYYLNADTRATTSHNARCAFNGIIARLKLQADTAQNKAISRDKKFFKKNKKSVPLFVCLRIDSGRNARDSGNTDRTHRRAKQNHAAARTRAQRHTTPGRNV